ncbi:hypothetical protein C7212DRAFT_352027 [Tuber magnatum]|uniref:Tr-type G domain-containing protein n=1 Tax=Tuber magnatum TaxID=42249 RepID=A0A317SNQ2_9PEZI|nr:hypothetical protein C7212DRAFT_352027 [Tuber magnatum]
MDIATNHFSTASTNFIILDAPGHPDFAVLVLDASTGAFESGFQNNGRIREHALLPRAIGVVRVIVAVNKVDVVNWNHNRCIERTPQMGHFFSNAGFSSNLRSFVPCSGPTGANIVHDARDKLPWYSGPTFLQTLESSKPRSLQIAAALLTLPSREYATAKDIEINEWSSEWAVAGHNVTLHLSGLDIIHQKPGDVIRSPDSPIVPLNCFDLKILSFETITPMLVGIYRGPSNANGRVVSLLESMDKATGKTLKKEPRHIAPCMLARVRVEDTLGAGIPVEKREQSCAIIRLGGKTVAAGVVGYTTALGN